MTILSFPAAPLYLASLALTVLSRLWKKGAALSYPGGLCWAVGTLAALVDGAALREVLVVTLLLLLAAGVRLRRDAP